MATTTCEILDIPCHYNNTIEQLKDFFLYIWDKILSSALALINMIPVPSWAENSGSIFGGIPSGIAYFMNVFEINFGLAVLASALTTRFLIRRLPFVG